MKEEMLQEISKYTKAASNMVIEAAHIYADQEPNGEQSAGALVASTLLDAIDAPSHKLLFIDDYHPNTSTLDVEAYHQWLATLGFPVDQTIFESNLVPEAHQLLSRIKEIVPKKKLSLPKSDGLWLCPSIGLWTPRGKVSLITQEGKPSCSLLDASLYIKKAEMGAIALTILPECYLLQQLDTLAVLQRVGYSSPIVNVFFDPADPIESVSVKFSGDVTP